MIPLDKSPADSAPVSEQPLVFFESVRDGFERAATNAGEIVERFYSIGGYCVRLQFAGLALVECFTPAFAHLRIEPQDSFDLSVGLWDSTSTHTYLAPPPWAPGDCLPRCSVRDYIDTRIQVSYEMVQKILTVLDTETNQGYFWIRDAAQVPAYQCGSPLLLLLHQWMALHNRSLVHGGAVGTPEGGVLLVGKGGSGKSTATLCCLDSPLMYAADDYGLVGHEPEPYLYSLYSSGKVNLPDVDKHPFIAKARHAAILDTQKALYFLHSYFPDKISIGFPLRAIVVPRVAQQRDTIVRPTSQVKAMMALAPSTLFQLPGAETEKFGRMSQLVKTLPAYSLESGSDWSQIPARIRRVDRGLERERCTEAMNPTTPLLSIIIPLYNAALYLEMAVASIFRQDLVALGGATEIVIINDGSTDNSGEVAQRLAAQHLEILLIEQENRGPSSARNVGIARSRGEIICFLDADDEYADGALTFFLGELEALRQQFGDLVMVRGQVQYLKKFEADGEWHIEGTPLALSMVTPNMQTRATIEKVGLFDEELMGPEDIDWLLRAEEEGVVMPLRERVTLLYRQHETNLTRNTALMREEQKKMLRKSIQRKHAQRVQQKEAEKTH